MWMNAVRRNFSPAADLCGVSGKLGKIDKSALLEAMAMYPKSFVHHGRPGAVTLTQSTEIGTLYSLEEMAGNSSE